MPSDGLPRMRGDRPCFGGDLLRRDRFTPHARGSTLIVGGQVAQEGVYPACAGIDLLPDPRFPIGTSLPRMRGDRPATDFWRDAVYRFTPHARGSTHMKPLRVFSSNVYPACAGIDQSGASSETHG